MDLTSGDNIFTRKLGPLPGWAWVLVGVGVIYGYEKLSNKSSTSSTTQGQQGGQAGTVPMSNAAGYYPTGGYGVSSSASNDNSMLESFLSILAANGAAAGAPSPGNAPAPAASPGNTGNPAVQPVQVDHNAFSMSQPASATMTQIGTVSKQGEFSGFNVGGGAPEYVLQGGNYVQDFNWATLPVGTGIYVPSTFQGNISTQYVSGQKV